jgi:S-DNA-T family DNA segregation ATPase FtsK/SpoIIIE
MERSNLSRTVLLFVSVSVWVFLLLSVGSFHATDWPSHDVAPYPPIRNVCGSAGAVVAYYVYFAMGPGIFPVLFFSGVCLALYLFKSRVGDFWLRAVGLVLLSVSFSAAIHYFKAGSPNGFPEGHGGIVGIGTATYLAAHFGKLGTPLILLASFFIGLLLTADDLVLRTPALVGGALGTVKRSTPDIKWNFPSLPRLPSLPQFVTRDGAAEKASSRDGKTLKKGISISAANQAISQVASRLEEDDEIELTYEQDEPVEEPSAAVEAAYTGEADPEPSAAVVVPAREEPPAEQAEEADEADEEDEEDEALDIEEEEPAEAAPAAEKKDIIVKMAQPIVPRPAPAPLPPPKELGEYQLPSWDLLDEAEHGYAESQERFVREKAAILEQALREFNIDASVVEIDTGPVITMYEISLAPGIKVSAITALSNDIARALKAVSVRIVAPVPGKNTVGIEVPNEQKEKVRLKELMQHAGDRLHKMRIPLYLGKDASGEPLITDLVAMPHCLIAGTTGSGKSVCINTIIMSIMYMQRPDMVKLILIDPKVVEMAPFKDIPHLMCPVINDCGRATSVLEWACTKMDERYELLAEAGVRNIKDYNNLTHDELMEKFQPSTPEEEAKIPKHLPYVVIIVDELADLMMTSGKEVESFIVRLAQKSRAVGIHLILATQRPSANVVTGLIKSNMPSRIAFRVQSRMDSRIVLDQNGADLLLGQGDMLFMESGANRPVRSQGTFIDDKEIHRSVKLVKTLAEAQYEPELVQIKATFNSEDMKQDELFDDAVKIVIETKRGSVSLLQRRLTIGYGRASRLIEMMAASGILGEYKGSQAREVTITLEEWEAMKGSMASDAESGMSV